MSKKTNNKKMLYQLEKEIKKLEIDIKYTRLRNLEIRMLRDLKIALRTGQLLAPYTVAFGIIFGIFSFAGNSPFVKDEVKQNLRTKKEFDSLGNVRYVEQYAEFDNDKWTLFHTEKWKDIGDGLYARIIDKYIIDSKMTEEVIAKIVNGNEVSSLEELFGKPDSSYVEKKNNLTEEELNENATLKAIIYLEDINDYAMVRETISDNIGCSVLYLVCGAFTSLMICMVRGSYSSFNYADCVNNIKERYTKLDVETLKKKLEIKKSNYERLTR